MSDGGPPSGKPPGPDDDDDSDDQAPGAAPTTGNRRRLPDEGTVEVYVADEQGVVAVDTARWQRLAGAVLDAEGIRGEAELSLLFVDEVAMAELNARFLGGQGPTDVLAFPLEDDLAEPGRWPDSGTPGPSDPRTRGELGDLPLLLGDVVICPAVAARAVAERSDAPEWDDADELALLVVHGTLHVLGHDHAGAADEATMRARERDLLARFHRPVEVPHHRVTAEPTAGEPGSGVAP